MTSSPQAPYAATLLAFLGDADPFAVMAALAPSLEAATLGLSDEALRRPEREGKWSVLQVIQHLTDNDLVYAYRVRMILTHDGFVMERYDRDRWASTLRYHDAPVADALAELRVIRARNLRLFRALGDAELERTGLHEERGPESIRTIVTLLAGHDLLHRAQIARIVRAVAP
ncbi:MAG: DinB family protein [Gemmatimonadaceae bacterium]